MLLRCQRLRRLPRLRRWSTLRSVRSRHHPRPLPRRFVHARWSTPLHRDRRRHRAHPRTTASLPTSDHFFFFAGGFAAGALSGAFAGAPLAGLLALLFAGASLAVARRLQASSSSISLHSVVQS